VIVAVIVAAVVEVAAVAAAEVVAVTNYIRYPLSIAIEPIAGI
jgi:hypothetical protein